MPPLLFRFVALLIAVAGVLYVVKPAGMTRWRVRTRTGADAADVEPSEVRLWFSRLVGVVMAVVGFAAALGRTDLLF